MESLALVVTIMVMSCISSGPFALALTSKTWQRLTQNFILKVFRRVILGIVNTVGAFLSIIFLIEPIPYSLKVVAVITLSLNLWSVDREYGGRLTKHIKRIFRRDPNGPAGQR